MKILFAASEALPFVSTGGLADVAGSLPRAIRNKKQACRVVMPLYGTISQEYRDQMKFVCSFYVPLSWRNQYCGVFEIKINGVVYYLLDNEYYFNRDGIYGFYDDAERFAFFSKAILEMLLHIDYAPDIISCNDWQTALVPVFLNIFYRKSDQLVNTKTVFTIHNIQYQGKYGMELCSDILGIPNEFLGVMCYDKCLNMMKAAIVECDRVTTVSPTYAQEILDPWFSHGLDGLLRQYRYKLVGILNGIDTISYDPETDTALATTFSASTTEKKAVNKAALQKELGLAEDPDAMMIGIVTRFVSHKGVDLIKFVFDDMMKRNIQIVTLGSGEVSYEQLFTQMVHKYPGRVSTTIGFIPKLARKIYGSVDAFLMPSKSEPCGLAQMISLRYGTIPIVRETGGLKDSIIDIGEKSGTGFTFKTYNAHDMLGAIDRAVTLFESKPNWKAAVKQAMAADCSWERSADDYMDMYEMVINNQ